MCGVILLCDWLYVLSMFAHTCNITIDSGLVAPGHGRDVFDGFNYTYKRSVSMLMTSVQLPVAATYDS